MNENEPKESESKRSFTISRPGLPDLPVTVVAHGGDMLHVDMAIALLYAARDELAKDERKDSHGLSLVGDGRAHILEIVGALENLPR